MTHTHTHTFHQCFIAADIQYVAVGWPINLPWTDKLMLWGQPEQLMRKKVDPTRAEELEIWPHVLRSQARHRSATETDTSGVGGHKDERFSEHVWSSEGGVIRTSSRSHPGFTHFTCWKPHLLFFSFFFPPLSGTVADVFFWWQPSFLPPQMCVCGTAFLKMLLNYSALVWGGILMSSLCCIAAFWLQVFMCLCICVCEHTLYSLSDWWTVILHSKLI